MMILPEPAEDSNQQMQMRKIASSISVHLCRVVVVVVVAIKVVLVDGVVAFWNDSDVSK